MFDEVFNNNLIALADDQARVELRNDLLLNSYSSYLDGFFEGIGEFRCVCLTNATELQQKKTVLANSDIYFPIKVRPLDIHGFIIPNPCEVELSNTQLPFLLVQAHPIAFAIRPAGKEERPPVFGDILNCTMKKTPKNSGKIRSIRYKYPLNSFLETYNCSNKFTTTNTQGLVHLNYTTMMPMDYSSINNAKNQFNKLYEKFAKSVKRSHKKHKSKLDRFDHLFIKYGRQFGVDPALVKAIAYGETGHVLLSTTISSPAGARGLMQFMPATAREYGMIVNSTTDERTNAVKSISGGAKYLSKLYNWPGLTSDETDPLRTMLQVASYNAGPGAVGKRGIKILDTWKEPRSYVPKVLSARDYFASQPEFIKLLNQ